jgi:hypothetical protein
MSTITWFPPARSMAAGKQRTGVRTDAYRLTTVAWTIHMTFGCVIILVLRDKKKS